MQLIRCTAKLIKEMGLNKTDLNEESPKFSYLGQWHANLVYINRRKCVLFVNDKILLNFIVADVSRVEIKNLDEMFTSTLQCFLLAEGFSSDSVDRVLMEYAEVRFAKTNNRSVLGSMNELAYHYEYNIIESGGPKNWAVPTIISKLNKMPMRAKIGYIFPLDELKKLFKN